MTSEIIAATISVIVLIHSASQITAFSLSSSFASASKKYHTTSYPFFMSDDNIQSIDVSDLGLTLDDFDVKFPTAGEGGFQITASGYESTSRIPSDDNKGLLWEEDSNAIGVNLSIPGLRGQPVAAMDVAITSNTCTVTVFGYAVWSCIFKGVCLPESSSFQIGDGNDMTPLITLSIDKKTTDRWDGIIASIGEDSIL